jgi:hypothetical protein
MVARLLYWVNNTGKEFVIDNTVLQENPKLKFSKQGKCCRRINEKKCWENLWHCPFNTTMMCRSILTVPLYLG